MQEPHPFVAVDDVEGTQREDKDRCKTAEREDFIGQHGEGVTGGEVPEYGQGGECHAGEDYGD